MIARRDRHRVATVVLWCAIGTWGLWAVVRLLGVELGFPLVALIAYTPYAAITAIVPLLAALALRRRAGAVVATAVLVTLYAIVLPRGLSSSTEIRDGIPLRVMTANLLAGRADPDAVVDLVRTHGIGILSVQELTPGAVAALGDAGLERLLPHRVARSSHGVLGTGIYARWPLVDRSQPGLSAGGTDQVAVRMRVPGGGAIEVVAVHPLPPTDPDATATWRDGLRSLPSAGAPHPRRLLLGDFNATLDHAELRDVLDRGYDDAADAAGDGLVPTWPSDLMPPPVTIDHILLDERLGVADVSVHDLPGSDHRTVSARVLVHGS